MFKKTVYFFVSLLLFINIEACDRISSQAEIAFKKNVKKLNELLIEYKQIPVEKKKKGYATAAGKNQKELDSFNKKTAKEWESIDNALSEFEKSESLIGWKIDAFFCRAVMYNALVEIDYQNKGLVKKAINSLEDYIAIASEGRLDKWTKEAMGKSVFENYRKLFHPNFSDEENISVIFQMYIGMNLMRLKEYEKAVTYYKNIVINYPTTLLAETAKVQIKTCRDALEGKLPNDVLNLQESKAASSKN